MALITKGENQDWDFGFSIVDPKSEEYKSKENIKIQNELNELYKLTNTYKYNNNQLYALIKQFLSKLDNAPLDKDGKLVIIWPNKGESIAKFIKELEKFTG